tara:strand:- start:7955 stop:8917 length:963 start_codon:yes stop_codon:yes gene_type:complete
VETEYADGTFEILPEMYHLPCSAAKAEKDRRLNIEANIKIKNYFFADNLLLFIGLPKSASSVMSSTVADLMGVKRTYASYMLKNQDPDLRIELVKDFLDGGVLKYHPSANIKNLAVIDKLKLKYVVSTRHPLDQITSLYCHHLKQYRSVDSNSQKYLDDPIFTMSMDEFAAIKEADKLLFFVEQGYMSAMLDWISSWLKWRDRKNSMVLRYEDFFSNDDWVDEFKSLWGESRLRGDNNIDLKLHAKKYEALRSATEVDCSTNIYLDNSTYEKGWTGKVGTWRDYFDDRTKAAYDNVVERFIKQNPNAKYLIEQYQDLFDI